MSTPEISLRNMHFFILHEVTFDALKTPLVNAAVPLTLEPECFYSQGTPVKKGPSKRSFLMSEVPLYRPCFWGA